MDILEEVNHHRNDIVTDTYTMTWRELITQYSDDELKINPDYQRLFRWDLDQQSQFIESILLNIPSPPLFLARNEDATFEVIDGLQRISTVLKFFAVPADDGAVIDEDLLEINQNNIQIPTILTEGRILKALGGHSAATLPETLTRIIRYARIQIFLLERESTGRARYEVFRRLNKFGSPLSDQEIRNCTSRLLSQGFADNLRKLAEDEVIREVLALSDEAAKRMGVEEAILRLLALTYSENMLKHQIREYLDDFMEFASEGKFELTNDIQNRVKRTFEIVKQAFPDNAAFRLRNQSFSTNLFDIVATGVFHNVERLSPQQFRVKYDALVASGEMKALMGAGSNTRKKLQGRISLGKRWFAE